MNSWFRKLGALFHRSRRDAEIGEELAFHLEEEAEEQQALGRSVAEAHQAAQRSLGNATRVQEDARAAWGFVFLETALQDFRIAGRSLVHNPRFSVVAILILGLGIGASTAVFSVVNAVVLKPLPYREPSRIAALSNLWKKTGQHGGPVSLPDFDDWRSRSASFESMAYYSSGETVIGVESGAELAIGASVSSDFFRVLGVVPAMGRLFQADETAPGSSGAVVISDSFWRTHFGADPGAIGKSVRIADHPVRVVGIMPPGFRFPDRTETWIPSNTIFPVVNPNRGGHNYLAIGRLKAGVSLEQAQAEMTLIGDRLEQQYTGTNQDKNVAVTSLGKELVRDQTHMLYLLLGAVLLLLLISCGNVANLLLAKAATRTREIGVRVALGAARARIVRQLATESLVLGIASGMLGLFVAWLGVPALVALAPGDVRRLEEAGLDNAVLGFAAILTLLACLLFGLAPAFRAAGVEMNRALKQGGSRGSRSIGSALRAALVVAEVAFSVVLLTGAGLLIRSFAELSNVALGFETRQILVMETSNPTSTPEQAARVVRRYRTLMDQAARVPGIVAVAATRIPPGRVGSSGAYEVDAAAELSTKSAQAVYSIVSPGAFRVLGIPLRRGRDFSDADGPDAPLAAIVNESLARRALPGSDPIGHTILAGMDRSEPMTIVGVVADIHQKGPAEEGTAEIYMPYEQHPRASTFLRILARTSVPPENVMQPLRQTARQLAPEMPVKFTTMEGRMRDNVAAPRFRTFLLAIFAATAMVLAMAGVYGVVSFLADQRTREIGLRMALGAGAGSVMNLVLSQGVRMAAAGLILGGAAAAVVVRFIASMLFGVKPFDPLTYFGVAALMALVTVGACLLPAWRAARIDPMAALRQE